MRCLGLCNRNFVLAVGLRFAYDLIVAPVDIFTVRPAGVLSTGRRRLLRSPGVRAKAGGPATRPTREARAAGPTPRRQNPARSGSATSRPVRADS